MFCAIELCSSKKKLVIKANWIKHFSVAKTCNRGLDSQIHEKFVAFYSPDVNAEPTFIQSFKRDFSVNKCGVFLVKIYRFVGKLAHIIV